MARKRSFEDRPPRGRVVYEVLDRTFKGEIKLNRSKRWEPAKTYQEARDKSPSTRPVV
jgi:hypothetical protein